MSSTLYTFSDETLSQLKKFRMQSARGTSMELVIYQISKTTYEISSDGEVHKSFEELIDELPDNSPSFVVLSYPFKLPDGRFKIPLVLVYYRPATSTQENKMLYAAALELFREKAGVSKVIHIVDEDEFEEIPDQLI